MSGERGYQLVIVAGEAVRTVDLPRPGEVTVGRDEACGLRIDDPSVSRRHAVLRVGAGLELEDLGGANGTVVRQTARAGPGNETANVGLRQVLGRTVPLAVGDCLLFGTVCAMVRHMPANEVATLAEDSDGWSQDGAGGPGVVVRDPEMRALYGDAARVARTNINVLLLGETGVGKEVLARAVHAHSVRARGPFMGINCAALAESLLENELFGNEKGAFTGALGRAGLFEAANGGTVFLDEVGELPMATQAKLLRVLEERTVMRLGSTRPRPIDVRFLAATNRDLEADVRQGRVRADLFFRLNGISLVIPPLRERRSEIEVLARSFLAAACRDMDRIPALDLSPAALERLRQHAWPGNIRELRNVMERAAVLCTESTILPQHLPPSLASGASARATTTPGPASATSHPPVSPETQRGGPPLDHAAHMRSLEHARILEALERCGGNQSKAARQLGMPRRTLVSRLTEFGLTRRRNESDPNDAKED